MSKTYDQLSDKHRGIVDQAAQDWLDQFDKELSLGQNLIMCSLAVTCQTADALASADPIVAMGAAVGGRDDDVMNGLYVGLILSAHDPSLAGLLLEELSTTRKKIMAEAIETCMAKLWELANEG